MSQAVMGGHEAAAERPAIGGRTTWQGIFGLIAVILGIVGLAIAAAHPAVPMYLDAIAAIALGLSLIAVGFSLAAGYGRLLARAEGIEGIAMGGQSVGVFVGTAVIVLGILALLSVASGVLIAVEAILIGTGLILNSAASARLASLEAETAVERTAARRVSGELVYATAGVRAIAGVAVGILGILAIVGSPYAGVLTLAAMIVGGAAVLVNSTSMSGRIMRTVVPRSQV